MDGSNFLFVPAVFLDAGGGCGASWESVREFPRVTFGFLSKKNPGYFAEVLWGL